MGNSAMYAGVFRSPRRRSIKVRGGKAARRVLWSPGESRRAGFLPLSASCALTQNTCNLIAAPGRIFPSAISAFTRGIRGNAAGEVIRGVSEAWVCASSNSYSCR